jgi:predicted ArsR family transcriptional regulator
MRRDERRIAAVDGAEDTRRRLLALLKRRGRMAVGELAGELAVTQMAVRKHIAALEAAGLVEAEREPRPVGRPRSLYHLTPAAEPLFPQSYPQLTVELLEDVRDLHGATEVHTLFQRRSDRLYDRYRRSMKGLPLEDQVAELARLRDEDGFMCDWRREPDGTLVLEEHNCPLFQVASRFNEACTVELDLFRSLLEAKVQRQHWMVEGKHVCRYMIQPARTDADAS